VFVKPTPSHEALVDLGLPLLFTTNYDELIEDPYASASVPLRVSADEDEFKARVAQHSPHHLVKFVSSCRRCESISHRAERSMRLLVACEHDGFRPVDRADGPRCGALGQERAEVRICRRSTRPTSPSWCCSWRQGSRPSSPPSPPASIARTDPGHDDPAGPTHALPNPANGAIPASLPPSMANVAPVM
jgi:hypothetical protein